MGFVRGLAATWLPRPPSVVEEVFADDFSHLSFAPTGDLAFLDDEDEDPSFAFADAAACCCSLCSFAFCLITCLGTSLQISLSSCFLFATSLLMGSPLSGLLSMTLTLPLEKKSAGCLLSSTKQANPKC